MQGICKTWPGGEVLLVQTADVLRFSVFPIGGVSTQRALRVSLRQLQELELHQQAVSLEWAGGQLIVGMLEGRLALLVSPNPGEETPKTLVVTPEELSQLAVESEDYVARRAFEVVSGRSRLPRGT